MTGGHDDDVLPAGALRQLFVVPLHEGLRGPQGGPLASSRSTSWPLRFSSYLARQKPIAFASNQNSATKTKIAPNATPSSRRDGSPSSRAENRRAPAVIVSFTMSKSGWRAGGASGGGLSISIGFSRFPRPRSVPPGRSREKGKLSIGTQKGPPIGVQKGPLSWRIRVKAACTAPRK